MRERKSICLYQSVNQSGFLKVPSEVVKTTARSTGEG